MRWVVAIPMLVLLLGCGGGPSYRPQPDGPPVHVPHDLSKLPDPVPRKEPKSKRGNPASYTVRGRTYFVMPTAEGYSERGGASWYGRKFHGRLTSSGEPFDMFQLTAAHKSLPIPTYVRVTNLDNGRKTIVRVNDRGPFHPDRIIDLSYAAAVKLGFHQAGTAKVHVEVLDLAPKKKFMVQAGAFSSLQGADQLKARLGQLTSVPAFVVRTPTDALYRVRLGPVLGQTAADELLAVLHANQLGKAILIEQ